MYAVILMLVSADGKPWASRDRFSIILVTGYAIFLLALSAARPFWLDEILQLLGTRDLTGSALLTYVRDLPGAAPLGYFLQHWTIAIFGFSPLSARLSSEIFSVLSCIALAGVGRQLGMGGRWRLLCIWMLLPLQLRYALEGRPYSQAVFFAVFATWCFLRLRAKPTLLNSAIYSASVLLSIYSSPYTLYLQLGYIVWCVAAPIEKRTVFMNVGAVALAGAAFLPWYVNASPHWKTALAASSDPAFSFSPKFLLLPIKELSGGGYVCSIALAALAILGCFSSSLSRSAKNCMLWGLGAAFVCPFLSGAIFGYFFAIRQVIFVLIPMTLLAAEGVSLLLRERRWIVAAAVLSALVAGSIVKDARYLSDRSEDWKSAAAELLFVTNGSTCLDFVDSRGIELYRLFEPALVNRSCAGHPETRTIAIAATRYTSRTKIDEAADRLYRQGAHRIGSIRGYGTEIAIFSLQE